MKDVRLATRGMKLDFYVDVEQKCEKSGFF
jgi:hypothetical protein